MPELQQPRTLLEQLFMPIPRSSVPPERVVTNLPKSPVETLNEPLTGPTYQATEGVRRILHNVGPELPIREKGRLDPATLGDVISALFVPRTKGEGILAVLPVGWTKNAKSIPLSKLSRFAQREGVPREEMASALGKTLGERLRSVKLDKDRVAEDVWEDVATGERVNLNQLRTMFGDEVLQEADLIPYTPVPLDRPGRAPRALPDRWSLRSELARRQEDVRSPHPLARFWTELEHAETGAAIRPDRTLAGVDTSDIVARADQLANLQYPSLYNANELAHLRRELARRRGTPAARGELRYSSVDPARQAEDMSDLSFGELVESHNLSPEETDIVRNLQPGQSYELRTNVGARGPVISVRQTGGSSLRDDIASGAGGVEEDVGMWRSEDLHARLQAVGQDSDEGVEIIRELTRRGETPVAEAGFRNPAFRNLSDQQLEARLGQLPETDDPEAMAIILELENRRGPRGTTRSSVLEQLEEDTFIPPRGRRNRD